MSLVLIVWAIGTLPQLAAVLLITGIFGVIAGGIARVITIIAEHEDEKRYDTATKVSNRVLIFSLIFMLLGGLIPDKDTSYKMLAAYGVQTLIDNPTAQELGKDGVDVLKALMAKAKEELETESK